jgi:gentisate 1,2-dioxygenase
MANPEVWDRASLLAQAVSALEARGHPSGRFVNGRIVSVLRSPHRADAADVALGFSAIPPGLSTEAHDHVAEEIAFVLAGCGYVDIDGERFPLEQGSVVFTPSSAEHRTTATGDQPMICAWVYAPAGSELRWLASSEGAVLAADPGQDGSAR